MERQILTVWLIFSSQIVLADLAGQKNAIEIYSLHVDSKVTSRFAHTVITSRVVNRANVSHEALFEVELPKTAFITNFSMTIDGKTYPGIIKEKKAAQDQYDAAVSRGQSAGLVRSTGRKLEQFHVSVNVAAAGKVTFELIYEELLKRKLGKYELLIKVKPKQLVKHFQIDTHIFEPQGISFLETDSTFLTNELSDALTKMQGETKAHIIFKPTVTQQRKSPELEETLLDGDFIIRYDVKRSMSIGDIQIVNGYFVHYFAPSEIPVFPKNIVFVIDRSGSMFGKKIQQTKEALQKILEDLNPEDHFNLIIFNSNVVSWKPSLLTATEENVELAKQYVGTIEAQGATDINGALLIAIQVLDEAITSELLPEKSISMIILLTDGQPTSGVTAVHDIQKNIKQANNEKYFLYCLGFGFDVSYTFLEKMALDNGGIARRIYEDADAVLQLQNFYHEVATPILKEIEMDYLDNTVQEITQNNFKLFFNGSEIVVAGKTGNELDVFLVEIKAKTQMNNLTVKEQVNVKEREEIFQNQKYIFGNFIERLWAYLTIQQLLEKSVSAEGEQQKNLKSQALELSLKFSFVTPLTSMVVTKPDAEEVANKPTEAGKVVQNVSMPNTNNMTYSEPVIYVREHRDVSETQGSRNHCHALGEHSGCGGEAEWQGLVLEVILTYGESQEFPMLRPDGHMEVVGTGRFTGSIALTGSMGNILRVIIRVVWGFMTVLVTVVKGLGVVTGRITEVSDSRGRYVSAKVDITLPVLPPDRQYPHFILQLPGKNRILCLNVIAPSQIPALQYLLSDPDKGIQVTGQLGEKKQFKHFEIAFQKSDVKLNVSKDHIVLDDNGNATMLPWTTTMSFTVQGLKVVIEEEKSVSISGADNITIKISYVKFPERFLGLYFLGSENFSDQVTGLLGQFYFNTHFENPVFENWRPIVVQGQKYDTSRQQKKDYRVETSNTVSCWALDISP
ncbi:inter-alpha-trypsin inhibitor heavy chain H4 [Heteronotia binoei]|uniref:inter-alpha-trypsin inhibitor heavy chain H4 n=1 Tax=Heteronotia binoei TaxID=13085 RepID=UPI002931ECE6|nr:inter-alpha-trypsin inhibitor heavy chain H4 [Heteronotia binoei]